jgi:hypothetical protein
MDVCKNINIKQKIQVIFIGFFEFIKISLASLLSVFVPQRCNNTVCSVYDNFSELSNYNIIVLTVNFILFMLFIITYIYELKREYFMIDNFDTDYDIPDDNLGKIIEKYPLINEKLINYNKYYHNLCCILYIIYIINWILSGILVFHYFYLDKNTIITMITNFLLVSTKIHKGYYISKTTKEKPSISAFMTEEFIYNIMDVKKYGHNDDNILNIIG